MSREGKIFFLLCVGSGNNSFWTKLQTHEKMLKKEEQSEDKRKEESTTNGGSVVADCVLAVPGPNPAHPEHKLRQSLGKQPHDMAQYRKLASEGRQRYKNTTKP
jgi:hypothetical protein